MKQLFFLLALCVAAVGCAACSPDDEAVVPPAAQDTPVPNTPENGGGNGENNGETDENNGGNTDGNNENDNETMNRNILITVGSRSYTATLADNAAARAFAALLPLTVQMAELNGNEKYAGLPQSLPTETYRPGTIRTGDLLLWGTNTVVLFYETFASGYSYTRLGQIDNPEGLAAAVGRGSVSVTFTRAQPAGE